jgi:putative ABC transport system ATP-binding protein
LTIVLVTHEHDITEFGPRVVAFRDGRVVSDQVVSAPRHAARELARLDEAIARSA